MINLEEVQAPHLWYVIGYIATDGCLSKDGRHINITSKDEDILLSIRNALGLKCIISKKFNSRGYLSRVLQFSDVAFYKFLLSIGLSTRKSLTIGELKIPNNYFGDFFRGVIDGDGSISSWVHPSGSSQWSLRVVSGSGKFINWLGKMTECYFNISGKIHIYSKRNKQLNDLHLLKFGKIAAKIILKKCYYVDCLALPRKMKQANECIASVAGWKRKHRSLTKVRPGGETGIHARLKISCP